MLGSPAKRPALTALLSELGFWVHQAEKGRVFTISKTETGLNRQITKSPATEWIALALAEARAEAQDEEKVVAKEAEVVARGLIKQARYAKMEAVMTEVLFFCVVCVLNSFNLGNIFFVLFI